MSKTKVNKNKKNMFKRTKKNIKIDNQKGGNIKPKEKKYQTKEANDETKEKNEQPEGVVDALQNKAGNVFQSIGNFISSKALRLVGLQKIKVNDEEESPQTTIEKKEESVSSNILENAQSVGSSIADAANKTSAAVVENVNEVLGSPQLNEGLTEAVENTKDIVEDQLENINEKLNDPKFKELAEETLENVGDYTNIAVKALDEPLDKVIDQVSESGQKAISGVLAGSVKVGTDVLAAVPGAGAIVEAGKIINDVSKSVGTVVEAGTEAATAVSELVIDAKENIDEGIKELENNKKLSENISNRTNESIANFVNPYKEIPIKKGGTRKKLKKNKGKSKRVRFLL
jgi:hypothetical protein